MFDLKYFECNQLIKNIIFSLHRGTENLLHRLFVCIAGVADQLQTNFASDLRHILRSVFLINTTPPQDEIQIPEKPKEHDMFEFRASENDVIHENSGGSNQSIYSAEEVSPEVDCVFENGAVTTTNRGDRSSSLGSDDRVQIRQNGLNERSQSLGEAPCEDDEETTINEIRQYNDSNKRSNTERERVRKSSSNHDSDSSSPESYTPEHSPINNNHLTTSSASHQHATQQAAQHNCSLSSRRTSNSANEKPPRWIPDEQAPRCMACAVLFTAFRRRHHCRNCGGVFCGVCSNSSAPLPKYGLLKAVRVCRNCYVCEVGA